MNYSNSFVFMDVEICIGAVFRLEIDTKTMKTETIWRQTSANFFETQAEGTPRNYFIGSENNCRDLKLKQAARLGIMLRTKLCCGAI